MAFALTGNVSSHPMGEPRGVATRRVAISVLERVDEGDAFANLVLGPALERSGLDRRDRGFVTEVVYGATRMRRALDHLIDRFLHDDVEAGVRCALRAGAYQIVYMAVPDHAAVSATVGAAPKRARGLVNAVLRKVAAADRNAQLWPSDAIRLSYPDWIVAHLTRDLGATNALDALEAMNQPAMTHTRADGYVQDRASQEVVELVGARPDELILDICAAPGGKATALAATGARIVAGDINHRRSRLIRRNAAATESSVAAVVADGRRFPARLGAADAVLVDAPCSGLGSLRRRPDARWRIDAGAPQRLAALQHDLVAAAASLVRPAGRIVYSVCTLTREETDGVIERFCGRSDWSAGEPVRRLPDDDGDGMWSVVLRNRPAARRPVADPEISGLSGSRG